MFYYNEGGEEYICTNGMIVEEDNKGGRVTTYFWS